MKIGRDSSIRSAVLYDKEPKYSRSSAGEQFLDVEKVGGSNPLVSTNRLQGVRINLSVTAAVRSRG